MKYPIVADINKTISESYDVLAGEEVIDDAGNLVVEGELVAYRGLFLIDREGVVRHQVVNDRLGCQANYLKRSVESSD